MKNFQNKTLEREPKIQSMEPPSVTEYMAKDVITFRLGDHVHTAIKSLLDNGISGAPVLDEHGEVVGLIDDKDCLRVLFGNVYNQLPANSETVEDYMTSVMKTISVHENIMDIAYLFVSSPYKRLLVMDDQNKLVGLISRSDILRAIRTLG